MLVSLPYKNIAVLPLLPKLLFTPFTATYQKQRCSAKAALI